MITFKEILDKDAWVTATSSFDVPLPQSFAYSDIQKKIGREVKRFDILNNDISIGFAVLVSYPLFGKLKYWYIPYGPVLSNYSDSIIKGVKESLIDFIKTNGGVFVRLDFGISESGYDQSFLAKYFTKSNTSSYSGAYFQPRAEWYTDISKSPEDILTAMHSKTRYSVRYAQKKGVTTEIVKTNLKEKLTDFLNLMKLTAKRNGFALHGDKYYECYFEEVERTGRGFVIEARLDGTVLASHLVFVVGDTAHYVFGATSDSHKDLCAPYLAHFNAMLYSKELGATCYNFGAISTSNIDKSWQGLTVFKQKFGGYTVTHSPFYDLVINPFWYYIYIVRKIVKKYI